MRRFLLLLALLVCPLQAADTVLPSTGRLVGIVISDEPGDWGVLSADLMPVEPKFLDGSKDTGWKVCVFEGAAGRYAVIKVPKGGGLKISTVILGGAGPVTPVPTPGPGPTPIPVPVPVPVAGMRVLILDETSPTFVNAQDRQRWQQQVLAMRSPAVKAYLDLKCLKGADGTPQWRKYDPNSAFVNMPREWQELRAKVSPTAASAWVVIADSTGRLVYEGQYPQTEAEALNLFKSYGG